MENRHKYIGGSEVGALFGATPWLTLKKLYLRKKGLLPEEELTARMEQGQLLEPMVLRRAFPDNHVRAEQVQVPHPTIRGLAATPDAFTLDGELIEAKTTRHLPGRPHYSHILQCTTQMMCTGIRVCHLVYYSVADSAWEVHRIDYDQSVADEIEKRVNAFWVDFDLGIEPEAERNDRDFVRKMVREEPPEDEAEVSDNYFENLLFNYEQIKNDHGETEAMLKEVETQIQDYMRRNGYKLVRTPQYKVVMDVKTIQYKERVTPAKEEKRVYFKVTQTKE